MAQYWKNRSELSNNEKIFSEFLNQVIEKNVLKLLKHYLFNYYYLIIIKMDEI